MSIQLFRRGDLYTIGDVDNNGTIDVVDAQYVLLIVEDYSSSSVDKVNNNITSIRRNICSSIVCAEAADANQDGYITEADSTAITVYYANMNVNAGYTDDYINSSYYTLVVA